MPADAVERLALRVGEQAGAPVELERPAKAEHGDYATNVALRLAKERGRNPRELAQEIADRVGELEEVERAEVAGPGFVNLWLDARLVRRRPRRGAARRRALRRRRPGPARADPGGDGLGQPDRPDHGAHGAERRLRRRGGAAARVRRARGRARVLLQRRRHADGEVPRLGGGGAERGRAAGGRLPGRVHPGAGGPARRPGPARCSSGSRRRSSASASTTTRGRCRASSRSACRSSCLGWTRTSATAPCGRGPRRTATSEDRVLIRSQEQGGAPTYRAADVVYLVDKLERGFDRAIYVLGADHHGTRQLVRGDRAHARLRPGAGRGAALPARPPHARRRAGEDVEAERRRGAARRLRSTRSAWTRPAGTSSRAGPTRRSRSTSTSRPRRRRRTRSTTSSTRTRASPGSCGTRRARRSAARRRPRLAAEERELVKRLADFPLVAAQATHRRAPQQIPVYAIGLADDFHRWYHEHRVLGSDAQAFRLGLARATQIVIARALDLVGVEAPERM